MTQARRIVPDATWLITRSCRDRRLKLVPESLVNQLFAWCVALKAAEYGIEVHAIVVMSNHWHAVVTDHDCNISLFARDVHSTMGRAMKAQFPELQGAFWSEQKTNLVELDSTEDLWRKLVYVAANPVSAALVERSELWPGLVTRPADARAHADGTAGRVVERPDIAYFAKRARRVGDQPAVLEITVPPALEHLGVDGFVAEYERRLQAEEERLRDQINAAGGFLGVDGVLAAERNSEPNSPAPAFGERTPHVAAIDKERRLAKLAELRKFRRDYREAWRRWKRGDKDVIFPYGTYKMRVDHRREVSSRAARLTAGAR